jgi:hypothetical protein
MYLGVTILSIAHNFFPFQVCCCNCTNANKKFNFLAYTLSWKMSYLTTVGEEPPDYFLLVLDKRMIQQYLRICNYVKNNWNNADKKFQSRLANIRGCLDKFATFVFQLSRLIGYQEKMIGYCRDMIVTQKSNSKVLERTFDITIVAGMESINVKKIIALEECDDDDDDDDKWCDVMFDTQLS